MTPTRFFPLLGTLLSLAAVGTSFAQAPSGRKSLVITKIAPTDALAQRMTRQGVGLSMDSVLQALDSQVNDRMVNTRRFNVLDRSDSDAQQKEVSATGGVFAFSKSDYTLTIRLDSFNDRRETLRNSSGSATRRFIEGSAVAKITENASGLILGTANVQTKVFDAEINNTTNKVGEGSDDLINQATRDLAMKLSLRAVDFIYPARIIGRRDKTVTINRNDSSGVEVGQVWEAFALGDVLVDPDTKEKTREEVLVGTVKITRVTPQNSQAEVTTDTGIGPEAVLRPLQPAAR